MAFSTYCKFAKGAPFYFLLLASLRPDKLILFIVTLMCLFYSDYFVYIKYIHKNMTVNTSRRQRLSKKKTNKKS